MGIIKEKIITLPLQMLDLKRTYGKIIKDIKISFNKLCVIIILQPTRESIEYTVKIIFKIGNWPEAWLLNPKKLATVNEKEPHHIYRKDQNGFAKLCVFYPKGQEWNDSMSLATRFVPWIVTWLSAYEYWQITGVWLYPEFKERNKKDE